MVIRKALSSYMPIHNVILWLFPSRGGVDLLPSNWAWPVNCFNQGEAKGACHDFHTYALRDTAVSIFAFLESWATKYKIPTSLTSWRGRPGGQRPLGVCKSTREIGSGSPMWFSNPAESPDMSVTPAWCLQPLVRLLQPLHRKRRQAIATEPSHVAELWADK